jgi:hypothetical protein
VITGNKGFYISKKNVVDGIRKVNAGGTGNIIQKDGIRLAPGGGGAGAGGGPSLYVENSSGPLIADNLFDTGAVFTGAGTSANVFTGNDVGVDDSNQSAGNTGIGVTMQQGANNNAIGMAGDGNVIAFNDQDGISITDSGTDSNSIAGNSIHDNGGAGVNLVGGINTVITSNTITNNTSNGLVVNAGATDTITDNTITQNAGVDMQILGGQTTATGSAGVAGTAQQTAGLVDIEGTLTVQQDYNFSDGTLSVGIILNDTGNFEQSGGILTGPGIAKVAGILTWTGGTMSDVGFTDLLPGGTLLISGYETLNDRTLLNEGRGTWTGVIDGGGGTFVNASTGVLNGTGTLAGRLQDNGNLLPGGASSIGAITVTGVYNENGTLNIDLGTSAADLVSASTVNLSGSLALNLITATPASAYTIVDNTGEYAVNGIFSGLVNGIFSALSEGQIFSVGSKWYQITYQGGDGNDVVLETPPTVTTLFSSANPSTVGNSVTFTADVAATGTGGPFLTGTVTFYADGVSLGSANVNMVGQATLNVSSLSVGVHAITAVYSGDSVYSGSASGVLSQTVNGNVVLLNPNIPSSVAAGQTFTLDASVMGAGMITPTGTVTFTLIDANGNETQLGSATLDGSGHASITASVAMAGSYHVRVSYSGDANYFAMSTTVDLNVYSMPPMP